MATLVKKSPVQSEEKKKVTFLQFARSQPITAGFLLLAEHPALAPPPALPPASPPAPTAPPGLGSQSPPPPAAGRAPAPPPDRPAPPPGPDCLALQGGLGPEGTLTSCHDGNILS